MIYTYLKTAWRNLLRNKRFGLINILGLTIGITSCLLIFLVIQFETSFDNYHQKKDRIYRVVTNFDRAGVMDYSSGIAIPAPAALRVDFPQLEAVAAMIKQSGVVISVNTNNGVKKFQEDKGIYVAEPQLFNIFDVSWLAGNPGNSLAEPNTVVLSKSNAEKFYGDWKNAMGQTLRFQNKTDLKVTGIISDPPVNSDIPLQTVISYKTDGYLNTRKDDWHSTSSSNTCFVVLPTGISAGAFDKMLTAFRDKHAGKPDNDKVKTFYSLQPLKEIHYDARYGNDTNRIFGKELITSLSLIGAFLLIIACVNFINLSTAQAVNRSKEVGVRKVLGGTRRQLMLQFLSETFLLTIAAVLLSVLISWLCLPLLGNLLGITLGITAAQVSAIGLFLGLLSITVTLLSGFYPALILSGFNPVLALKSRFALKQTNGISLRRALVVLQFVIAQVFIIGTLVVMYQMNYFRSASMGFNQYAVVNLPLPADSASHAKIEAVKNELLGQKGISSVSFSFSPPASEDNWTSDFKFNRSPELVSFEPSLKWADADFFKTYDMPLVAGRAYTPSDTTREFVVNETLIRKLGLKNPEEALGKEISFWGGRIIAPIVGVVKDFHNNSLKDELSPVVLGSKQKSYRVINVRMDMNQNKEVLAGIERIWNKSFPDYVYQYEFLDDSIKNFYKQENQVSQLYKIFAVIAIFISCLGLYGLVSFMATQRTKEVGIRKVLGASVGSIVYLFSKEFTVLILVAFLIATPLAWYFMHQWLNNFSFKIHLGIGFFAASIAGSMLIAWATVGYKAVKTALTNPVKSLRTE